MRQRGSILKRCEHPRSSWTRCRHSWAVVVDLGEDEKTGKRRQLWRTVASGEDPQRELTRLLREHDQGHLAAEARPVTVREYLEGDWLPHMRTRIRESTWQQNPGPRRRPVLGLNRSGEIVGEIPSSQFARLQADEQIVDSNLYVPFTLLGAEVARSYPADDRLVFQHAQARRRAKLEAAVRRAIFTNDDARPWISTEVPRFPVTRSGHDVEAVIAPLVPDWRKENRAVAPVRCEDGEDWQLQQVSEVVRSQSFAHSSILLLLSLDKQEGSRNILGHSRRPWSVIRWLNH